MQNRMKYEQIYDTLPDNEKVLTNKIGMKLWKDDRLTRDGLRTIAYYLLANLGDG